MQTDGPMQQPVNLVLFARFPVAGSCKTRLIPAVGEEGAADIHRKLTERTFGLLRQASGTTTIAFTGGEIEEFAAWLGEGVEFVEQAEGGLSERLLPFAEKAPVIFFGADTPDLSLEIVEAAIDGLARHRVVVGPAEDGGYYLIGMKEPLPELLTDMLWSTEHVLPETLRRLERLGIEPLRLPTLADCDRPEDLARWPALTS